MHTVKPGYTKVGLISSDETDLAFHFLRVLLDFLLDLIRQLVQLTLRELQQLTFLLEFLLTNFPAIIRHTT